MTALSTRVCTVFVTLVLALTAVMLRSVITPVALGALFAVLLHPLHVRLQPRLGKASGAGAADTKCLQALAELVRQHRAEVLPFVRCRWIVDSQLELREGTGDVLQERGDASSFAHEVDLRQLREWAAARSIARQAYGRLAKF